MHVHQKKSIIDLIFYDSQNLLPLFSVHYIVNTDISLSFRVVLPFATGAAFFTRAENVAYTLVFCMFPSLVVENFKTSHP